uniref:Beta-1,4-N-acetylgalactosaminyltransferase n=1 Tax=Clastoptera arizonana TaxID=38151 RepID=A0A1B6D717_9HEMI
MNAPPTRFIKIFLFVILVIVVVQYIYTSIYESRWIEPLFVYNSSLVAKNHIYVLGGRSTNISDRLMNSANSSEIPFEGTTLLQVKAELCSPIPKNLVGPLKVIKDSQTREELEKEFDYLLPGGRWHPKTCTARDRVAIIIPYRNREVHLYIFLKNIHPMLQRQQIDYGIFIIEQAGEGPFNRAMLMNIGFKEASQLRKFDCFIFHDVDLLPEDDRNLYTCPEQPRHMSVAIDVFGYNLPYNNLFGGVSAMTKSQFEKVNGFSNLFWGWGGEDDDMSSRIRAAGLHISRYPNNIARYTMLRHRKEKANPKRYEKLYNSHKRMMFDGINSLEYKRLDIRLKKLFTWVLVELAGAS